MKIAIIGTGYVGLVTGISLAQLDHNVVCIDQVSEKISLINSGISPFFEPGIEKSLKKVLKNGLFVATENLEDSVLNSDVTIIAVGTPTINNKIDLSAIKKVSEQVGKALKRSKKYQIVTVKSTVLPGVTETIIKPILEKYSNKRVGKFGLCMNPEFLREGSALKDALYPDRIIIGQFDARCGKEFAKIYAKVSTPKIFTNLWTAEMIKYATNALLATIVSYSNEIARISEETGRVDVMDVWRGVHLDKRLSPIEGEKRITPGILNYILSGCGYGGSCLPKDTRALVSFANDLGVEATLIKSVINVNNTQPQRVILLLKEALRKNLKDETNFSLRNKRVAVLGLSFKPDTDDFRESPALPIIKKLILEGSKVVGHDPMVYKKGVPNELGNLSIILADTALEAIKDADAAIIVTSWDEYIKLPPQFFKKNMKIPAVIDARRIYDKNSFISKGIIYKGIGL